MAVHHDDRLRATDKAWFDVWQPMEREWRPRWRQIVRQLMPGRGWFHGDQPEDGTRRDRSVIESRGLLASRTAKAGMHSGVTNESSLWFGYDPGQEADFQSREWAQDVQTRTYDVLAGSNFYQTMPGMYEELFVVGVACMSVDADVDRVVHFRQHTIGSYALAQDHKGRINKMVREVQFQSGMLEERFGRENLSPNVIRQLDDGKRWEWHRVCHTVEPNRDGKFPEIKRFPWRSLWWIKSERERGKFLRIKGYNSKPFVTMHAERVEHSAYAPSCPGMIAHPDVRQSGTMTRQMNATIDVANQPPLLANGNFRSPLGLSPGHINYGIDATSSVTALHGVRGDVAAIAAERRLIHADIDAAFFVPLFTLISSQLGQGPQRTAREIVEAQSEKVLMLSPVLQSVFNDGLRPTINRVFDIADGMGLFPDPPPQLGGTNLKVSFVSPLAQAQMAVEASKIEREVEFIVGVASAGLEEAADAIDVDGLVDTHSRLTGAPMGMLLPLEQRLAKRDARNRAIARQQAAEVAAQGASALRDVAQVDPDGNSVAARLVRATGAA